MTQKIRSERFRILRALIRKESLQIVRDPSTILISVVLPLILMFLYGFGVSLDLDHLRMGIVMEDTAPDAQSLVRSFTNSPYFDVKIVRDRRELEDDLMRGKIRGFVVIPSYFSNFRSRSSTIAPIQVIADGSEPNTANFMQNYAQGAYQNWLNQEAVSSGLKGLYLAQIQARYWYNEQLESRFFLLSGSLAIIMTLIGTLLTALVVSREWERGTMEALMSTPARIVDLVAGKVIPYFILGMVSMTICAVVSTVGYGLPLRGDWWVLGIVSGAFLFCALGTGLLISTLAKNQVIASQIAIVVGFLPAYILSGFLFEISSMPVLIQWLTYIIPAKYFVQCLQTLFLVGNVWGIIFYNMVFMLGIGLLFFLADGAQNGEEVGLIQRILALIWKEILAVFRDRRSRISIIMPPIIQLFIFTFAATLDVKNVPIGILNRDNGEQAFELVQRFHGSRFFEKIVYLQGVEDIQPFVDDQKGVMVVSIDEEFSRNLDEGLPANIQLILDGRKSNTAQIVAGYTTQIVQRFNEDFDAKAGIRPQNTALVPRFWFNPNLLYYWYNIPSLVATLSMLICLVITTQSVARERELGTFDQLLVSPLVPVEILLGKIIPGILIGALEGTLLMSIGVFIFGVPFVGSFWPFIMSLVVFVASISGVGLFISSLSATQQQAMLGTFIFMTPSVLLSGFATPIENMPVWLQPVTYLIPMKYMLVISKGIFLKGISLGIVLQNLWPMGVIGFFNLVGAGLFFRRRLA